METKNTENEKRAFFTVIDEKGQKIMCEVLFTIESDATKKNYIVYTDNSLDENGDVKVYASIYTPDQEPADLIPIETEREWKIIVTILESVQEEANKKQESSK